MKRRIISMVLALAIICGLIPWTAIIADAETYTSWYADRAVSSANRNNGTRLADFDSKYYKDPSNKMSQGQCTWYCFGRAWEKCGVEIPRWAKNENGAAVYGDARVWYDSAVALGWNVGSELRSNSIACYGSNHVIFIEWVDGNDVYYTEANYTSDNGISVDDGVLIKSTVSHMKNNRGGGKYQGCIYLDGDNVVTHTVDSSYGTNFTAYPKAKITAESIFDANHNQISSTAWIGTSDLCTIHEVYTDGCCKITYPLDNGGTKTAYSKISLFDVNINTLQVHCSTNSISLKLGEAESQTIEIWLSGYYSGNAVWDFSKSNSNVSHSWGEYTADNHLPLTITARAMGTTTLTISLKDNDTGAILASETVTVTIGAKSYTVTYNANGGSGAPGSQTKYHNTTLTLSSNKPTRSGYTFLGWSTSSAATSATYQSGGSFSINADTTLYAVWKKGCEGNVHNYNSVVTAPTCTEQGYTTHTCANCGDSYVDAYTSAWGHEYGEWYVSVEATCEDQGEERRDCQYCDHYETRATEAWGHEYGEWYVSVEATCEDQGEKRHDCQYCNYYETEAISAEGHNYASVVTEPTCTEEGYTTHTCSNCGDSYVDNYVPATGHEYEVSEVKEATCTEQGYTTHTCTNCGDTYVDSYVNALAHDYVYAVFEEPSTSAAGSLAGICSRCSGTVFVALPVLNITDYSYEVIKEPNYTEAGIAQYTWNTTTYGTFSFEVTLDKLPAVLVSIKVEKAPKMVYEIGESLDTKGMTVRATYSDGSTLLIGSGFAISGFDSTTVGEKVLTVSWGGQTTTITVTVIEPSITGISVVSQPAKTTYYVGDTLDTTGLTLLVTYSNGSSEIITNGFTCSPTELNTAGTQTVTVTFGDLSTTFTVMVEENEAFDPTVPHLVVETATAVAGDTVTVTVSIVNNPGFGGMAFDLFYDTSMLELVSYELDIGSGICVDSGIGTYENKVNFQYAGMSNVTGDGTLVTFTFKVKDTAEVGLARVWAVLEPGTVFTYEGRTEVDFALASLSGGVEIIEYLKGDVNGDGIVNNRDATRLMQYLAGWDVEVVEAALDVNGDGVINNRDATRLMQYLAGWDVEIH